MSDNWVYKKGSWYRDGIKQPGYGGNMGNGNKKYWKKDSIVNNVINKIVKIIKPEDDYIEIIITQGVYSPSSRDRVGKKKVAINICKIEYYHQTDMTFKPAIKTCIVMTNDTLHAEEDWETIHKLIEAAIAKSKGKLPCQVKTQKERFNEPNIIKVNNV